MPDDQQTPQPVDPGQGQDNQPVTPPSPLPEDNSAPVQPAADTSGPDNGVVNGGDSSASGMGGVTPQVPNEGGSENTAPADGGPDENGSGNSNVPPAAV